MSRIEDALKRARELSEKKTDLSPAIPPESCSREADTTFCDVSCEIAISSPRLIAVNDCNNPVTEEYKKLKTSIVHRIRENRLSRRILVTSALSGEGKSVTALNLAITLAQDFDIAVTLIDADLRSPSICRYLGLGQKPGLTEALRDGVAVDDLLLATGMGRLTILGGGHRASNPVELVSSPQMETLLCRIEQLIPDSYIIVDSCPVLPFAEPRILSGLLPNTLLVVKEGGTTLEQLQTAIETLQQPDILGTVFNKATYVSLPGGYNYYYDYAYRYAQKPPVTGPLAKLRCLVERLRGTPPREE